jgi:hypothetical protein
MVRVAGGYIDYCGYQRVFVRCAAAGVFGGVFQLDYFPFKRVCANRRLPDTCSCRLFA